MPEKQYNLAVDLPQEIWRIIPNFENYAVSNFGRVKRITPNHRTAVNRLLKPWLSKKGYPTVSLGHSLKREVHVLVAIAFLGPYPPGHEVNHIDTNTQNPHLDNLEYVTHRGNMEHAARNDCFKSATPPEKVRAIRQARAEGLSLNRLMEQFQMPKTTVWHIINNETRTQIV